MGNLLSLMLQIGQFTGGGDTQSSGFIAAYDLATGKFDGLLEDAGGNSKWWLILLGPARRALPHL